MNKRSIRKKNWAKPSVHVLSVRKDTFSGSLFQAEAQNGSAQVPKDPIPR
jgi:hypothetical protein